MNGALQAGVIANEAQRNEAICNYEENRTQMTQIYFDRYDSMCNPLHWHFPSPIRADGPAGLKNGPHATGVIANEAQRNEAICNNEGNGVHCTEEQDADDAD